jgi:predicted ATPase/DNA-binding SARP family transcriptional activator
LRRLLALLLVEPGRPFPVAGLIDELWDGQPPPGAETTLRASVSKLRSALGTDALTRSAAGYTLDVPQEAVDAKRFELLVREGRVFLSQGYAREASEQFGSALLLWQSEPFEGATEGVLGIEAHRLSEIRFDALEGRIEAELELGRNVELVQELESLVRQYPYRERLWCHLMLSLYRSGRQAEALAAYGRARTRLGDDLGLEPSEELKRLEQEILRQEVPPSRLPDEERDYPDLPTPLTTFVGRQFELNDVERLLEGSRLVTLTGVGGTGKTRLAIEVAMRRPLERPNGVVFVDLAPLSDPSLVVSHIGTVFDLSEHGRTSIVDQLIGRLRDEELLLVLDNCEHVRTVCAELVVALLTRCAGLRILATSREPLGVAGEVDYSVPPLALPPLEAEIDDLRSSEAVALFLARAREARPRLEETDEALTVAARIVRDLDGLPLALELAAARAKALSLEEIATALADRFRFLVSWRRMTPARHRTLEGAMDWSYDLLSNEERLFLVSLSVFAGGFSRAAATDVCLGGQDIRAVQLLGRLVDASLVVADEQDSEMRYRLLETVRQYGAARLDELPDALSVRARHAAFFKSLAKASWVGIRRDEQRVWMDCLGRDQDNIRSALSFFRDTKRAEEQLELAEAMWWFWWVHGDFTEGRFWLERSLASAPECEPGLRARALEGASGLAWATGDLDRAREFADVGRALHLELGDLRGEAACLLVLGLVARANGDLDSAERLFERCRELFVALGDDIWGTHNVPEAVHALATVAFDKGELEVAAKRYGEALELWGSQGDRQGVALSELYLGLVAAEDGRWEPAASALRRAIDFYREVGWPQYAAEALEGAAAVLSARGRRDAAQLLGTSASIRDRLGFEAVGAQARLRNRLLAEAENDLGQEQLASYLALGRAMAIESALELAASALSD